MIKVRLLSTSDGHNKNAPKLFIKNPYGQYGFAKDFASLNNVFANLNTDSPQFSLRS
jgi:hypothetical protein